MLGLIVGTLCLGGVFVALRRRHYYRYGFGGGWGGGRFGRGGGWREDWGDDYERGFSPLRGGACGGGGFRRQRRHGGPRHLLRALFARLDTTPGQEKAIANSLYETGERLRELRGGLRGTKRELAALIGSDVLDVAALEALLGQHQTTFDRARGELVKTIATIHEVLDTEQRRELSELLADGSLGSVFGRDRF
jgi:Spy/CpxP family protein refolding chaperone